MFIYVSVSSESEKTRIPVSQIMRWRKGEVSSEVILTMNDHSEFVIRGDLEDVDKAYLEAVAGNPADASPGY